MWLIANLLHFLINNDQISSGQSGFKTRDSYVNQILSIMHETYQSSDYTLNMSGFLHKSLAYWSYFET